MLHFNIDISNYKESKLNSFNYIFHAYDKYKDVLNKIIEVTK